MAPIPVNQTVSVGTTLLVIGAPLPLAGIADQISLEIKNTGSGALTGFKIQRQFTDNGDWVDWLANTDFNTATSKCTASGGTSGNAVSTLGAGASAWIDFDPGAVVAVQLLASAASATTLSVSGGVRLHRAE